MSPASPASGISEVDIPASQPREEGGEAFGIEEVGPLMEALRGTARGLLRKEGRAGTVKTTQLVLTALRRQKRPEQDWAEVSWANQGQFFGHMHRAMWQALVDYARRRARRREVAVGGLATEEIAPLVAAGVLDLRELADYATQSAEQAERIEAVLARLDEAVPGKELSTIVSHYAFEGLTQQEIGDLLGITERTVRRRLELAKSILAEALELKTKTDEAFP